MNDSSQFDAARQARRITEQAVSWYIEQQEPLTERQRVAFLNWLRASPRHVAEYFAVVQMHGDFKAAAALKTITAEELLEKAGRDNPVVMFPLMGSAIRKCFDNGEAVGLFPEGTTTEGFGLRPFFASLFEPAREAGVDIQPVALRFYHHGERSSFAAFVGEETLVANLWRVLGATGLSVEVVFLPVLHAAPDDAGETPTRLQLSHAARDAIAAQLS